MNFSDNNSNIVNNGQNDSNFDMSNNANLDVNKKNEEQYNQLMNDASTKLDNYYDKNNPFVKIFLLILGVVIVVGVVATFLIVF